MAPVLLFSIVAHEYAHAEAAYRQGDQTAYMLGRLTLNPLKHIDPFMTVLLPAIMIAMSFPFVFAAAKPVPVNPRNYRNYVRGDIIVSLPGIQGSIGILQQMMFWGMFLNLILAFFNLIPIPPLDGSHVLKLLLPPAAGMRFRQLYSLGFIPLVLVMWLLPGVVNTLMWPAFQLMAIAGALVSPLSLPGGWPL